MSKSVGIGDVQNSISGNHSKETVSQFEHDLSALAVGEAVVPDGGYVIYKLVQTNRQGPINIDGCDDVINPKTGKLERIWLIAGAHSIWQSELTELLKDKNYVSQNRRSLRFEGKILRLPTWDTLALEFADTCRHNIGCKNRKSGSKTEFFEYDPQKQAKAALDKEMLELDMAIMAKEQSSEVMMKHASFLGIQMIDELGRPKTEDGIRREYMLAAKRNPKLFQQTVNSKEVEISYMVKKAILDSTIDLAKHNNTAYFANGNVIAKIPTTRKPLEYLVELAMTNSNEGREFLDGLKRIS